MVKCSGCIASSTNTRDYVIGIFAPDFFLQLPFYFLRNDTLETCYQIRKRMWTDHTSDDIMRSRSIVDPITQRFIYRIFQCFRARSCRNYSRTQHFHSSYIWRLSCDIYFTHINDAFQIHQSACSRGCNSVLTGSCFCNDSFFS